MPQNLTPRGNRGKFNFVKFLKLKSIITRGTRRTEGGTLINIIFINQLQYV